MLFVVIVGVDLSKEYVGVFDGVEWVYVGVVGIGEIIIGNFYVGFEVFEVSLIWGGCKFL